LPLREQFGAEQDLFETLVHELAHSTGHTSRVNRKDLTDNYGTHKASRGEEELIAEISVALGAARLGVEIDFLEIDLLDRTALFAYIKEVQPESIVQFAEIPSAPNSMADVEKAVNTIQNNVVGTLGLLFGVRDHAPDASIIKLGTMGEYGSPLTGRPLFEGLFPGDAVLQYQGQEWSLGGELTPRDPVSFYHVSKVQGTFSVYEACKYWWLRSYDVMQGVIY
jgi:UDP-sulfoquinovose synthase